MNKSNAQSNFYDEPTATFTGGLVAGFNFATLDDDGDSPYDKIGANMGGVVFTRLSQHLDISMEMLFSQKGKKSNQLSPTGIQGVNFTYIYDRLNYVEVPVMLNYVDKRNDHFGMGFSYGRLVSSSEIVATDSYVPIQTTNFPFNKDDYEFLVGGEVRVWKQFYLNLRFQVSMSQIRTVVPTGFFPTEQYNDLWVLRLMYLFK